MANLKQHIAQRDARFKSIKKDPRALDERVEKQITEIVTTLSSLKNSNESKTRVAVKTGEIVTRQTRLLNRMKR